MEVTVRHLSGKKFEMTARGHNVLCDQPLEQEGNDAAMTPPELFLSSLGACAAYYAEEYLRVRALPDENLEIHVSAADGDKPARIVSLKIDVVAPGLTQRHRDGILRAVDSCLLKNTLHKAPEIEVRVQSSITVVEPEAVLV
ncbi:MAG: OsmC family protein [Bryobacteraceae bacterium]|jgi:uncharacterized OsmC-like protein